MCVLKLSKTTMKSAPNHGMGLLTLTRVPRSPRSRLCRKLNYRGDRRSMSGDVAHKNLETFPHAPHIRHTCASAAGVCSDATEVVVAVSTDELAKHKLTIPCCCRKEDNRHQSSSLGTAVSSCPPGIVRGEFSANQKDGQISGQRHRMFEPVCRQLWWPSCVGKPC